MSNGARISRRQFLRIIAAGGIAGLTLKAGLDNLASFETISETRLLMGTIVNLTLVTSNENPGRAAIRACMDRMAGLEKILSHFNSNSQLSLLNRQGFLQDAHPALLELITLSNQISQWSEGAFDISIKPLVDLYFREYADGRNLPSQNEIDEARGLVNYQKVKMEGERISFDRTGMSVTLDGIAKGFIVDQGVMCLREAGFRDIYVEAGGDLFASGEKQPGKNWKIGIKSPRKVQAGMLADVQLNNMAVATSGDYMQAFSADFSHNHIIDPRTGYSNTDLSSVTVVSPRTSIADALATTIMVMGTEAGLQLAQKLSNCEALMVTKDLEMVSTSGFPLV